MSVLCQIEWTLISGMVTSRTARKSLIGRRLPLSTKVTKALSSRWRHEKHAIDAMIQPMSPYGEVTHSITFGNDLEFADYRRIKETLKFEVFCAKLYRSYERGTNENMNGDLQRYYPQSQTHDNIHPFGFDYLIGLTYNRRRKVLGYKTSQQSWDEQFAELRQKSPHDGSLFLARLPSLQSGKQNRPHLGLKKKEFLRESISKN